MNPANISFIISTNRSKNHTLKSIPLESEIIISKSTPLGQARNDGVKKATKDWIVICDDDIKFSITFIDFISQFTDKNVIIGLAGYYPSPFVIGRFMMFHKSIFNDVGDFAIRSHGDETEWCFRAVKKGYKIIRIPRESVTHIPHTKSKPISETSNLMWLIWKHPDFITYILKLVFTKMKDSSYNEEYK